MQIMFSFTGNYPLNTNYVTFTSGFMDGILSVLKNGGRYY